MAISDRTVQFLRWGSLLLIIIQNTAQVVLTRVALTPHHGERTFLASTATLLDDCMKLVLSLFAIFVQDRFSPSAVGRRLKREMLGQPRAMAMLAVPGLLYVLQDNLIFLALAHLQPSEFQVMFQLKTMFSAVLAVLFLHKRMHWVKWFALVSLVVGVGFVEYHGTDTLRFLSSRNEKNGIFAVLGACATSAIAGCYFERFFKTDGEHEAATSMWVSELQLAVWSIPFGLMTVYAKDREAVMAHGFFQGYTPMVWGVITLTSLGGLLSLVVVSYADNIMKNVATCLSFIPTALFCVFLFKFHPTWTFFVGALIVTLSALLYAMPLKSIPCDRDDQGGSKSKRYIFQKCPSIDPNKNSKGKKVQYAESLSELMDADIVYVDVDGVGPVPMPLHHLTAEDSLFSDDEEEIFRAGVGVQRRMSESGEDVVFMRSSPGGLPAVIHSFSEGGSDEKERMLVQ
eukprot:comp24039_c0_seq1/m.43051 comp24039_c0_seq1/g.43051  ORF comp24039_c0_seq1/g.43051 comp24039_c0_seq1/m.43051 type:complete len:457 (-) comp24039_c0_seq1:191-1561(-)